MCIRVEIFKKTSGVFVMDAGSFFVLFGAVVASNMICGCCGLVIVMFSKDFPI